MIAEFINLKKQKPEIVGLSGNFNYGLFCGKRDTIQKGSDFIYDLLLSLDINEEEIKKQIKNFKNYCK